MPAELRKRAGERVASGDRWDEPEYEQYPPALKSPYRERRFAFGEQRHGAPGIPYEDMEARQRAASANWDCLGAPAALFCYIDRDLGRPQWSDVGMFCRPSCCCSAPKGCTGARRWRGRSVARPLRRSLRPRTTSSPSAACRSGLRTSQRFAPVRTGRRSTRRSPSSLVTDTARPQPVKAPSLVLGRCPECALHVARPDP